MSCRQATAIVLKCFVLWCALLAVGIHARSSHRHHRHHLDGINLIESHTESSIRLHEDSLSHRTKGRHSKNHESLEDTTFEEEPRDLRLVENQEEEPHRQRLIAGFRDSHVVWKRNDDEIPRPRADESFGSDHDATRKLLFDVEVKKAQNSSICKYTVSKIPDRSRSKSRIPKELVSIECNEAGSPCPFANSKKCCIQLYRDITVTYAGKRPEPFRIKTGCVCAGLSDIETEQYKARHSKSD